MTAIDQNTALFSLDRNLVPGRSLIDDRSERERLTFLVEFASLINYYDENNRLSGNWTPFLLKDPVFLVATISETRFEKWNALYVNTCLKVEKEDPLTLESTDLGASFNQLFDQFMKVFTYMERWTFYMQKMDDAYDLKSYVLYKIESVFSRYFWALRSFKEALFLSGMIKRITPVYYLMPNTFNDTLWTQNKDKNPYWEVLGLKDPITDNTADDFFHALKTTGDELFVFFHTVIQHAGPEYEKLKSGKSQYPDTTLLRAFISLLKVQQDQLNGLSGKHLEFYYRDILKQAKLFAIPDHTILCAETAKQDAAFHLPAGTLFDAGMDKEKNPIYFASSEEVTLNPAAISTAYTLSCLRDEGPLSMLSSLYFQPVENPGTIEKNEDGTIKQWETFGGSTPPPASRISLGIAFASPMLLLREGQRNITLTLTFEEAIDQALLQNAAYYLSTAAAWLEVKPVPPVSPVIVANQSVVQINLDPSQPPIEKFLTDPNGLNSEWPMLKIEFSSFINMSSPPIITGLDINVNVSGIKNLQLYNDNGLLTTKTPFQLFGPIPLKSNSFIIGSNEIFSKPFNGLSIDLDWDTLPVSRDFSVYYAQYNYYLAPTINLEPGIVILPSEKPSFFQRIKNGLGKIFGRKAAPAVSSPDPDPDPLVTVGVPFNNYCFTVGFQLLTGSTWGNFGMVKTMADPGDPALSVPYEIYSKCALPPEPPAVDPPHLLFSTDDKCLLTDTSSFGYTSVSPETCDPYIQNVPLVFTDTSTSGFMKMALAAPDYGFGAELYPILVSDIALQNAALLVGMEKKRRENDTPKFISPPVMPYVPKLVSCSANYSAVQQYDLTAEKGDYPLQCFFYSPFENYLIYDNSPAAAELKSSAGLTLTGVVWERSGLPIFPQLDYKGVLYLEIENLVPADSLNIFFELSRKYSSSSGSHTINYNYLSTTGWKELKVLADDTNNFTCSGVVKVNVPLDMATDSLVFPDKKYWIAIGVKDDPGNFAETVYLKTNGFDVYRSGISFLAVTEKPFIPADTIVKTKSPIPEIATIIQPFASEGGRAAETEITMNQRVSNRLKTKDRAVTSEDYFRLIRERFDDIYYSKVIYDPLKKSTEVYVVKAYDRATDPNAFLPLVSECKEGKIKSFLKDRASYFANINVSNFKIEYVKVKAVVVISAGYEEAGVRQNIINAINIFLSPWVASTQQQIAIDQGLSDAELAALIKNIEGVSAVESVSFETSLNDFREKKMFIEPVDQQGRVVKPAMPSALFVPYTTHDIQFSPVK